MTAIRKINSLWTKVHCTICCLLFTPTDRKRTCEKCIKRQLKDKEKKVKLKNKKLLSLSKLNKHCDELVGKYTRAKYKWQPCISCGRPWEANFQAGHFVPRSNYQLRWSIANIYLQCPYCNGMLEWNKYLFWKNLNKLYWEWRAEQLIEISMKPYVNSIEDRLRFVKQMYDELDKFWVERPRRYDDYILNM